MRERPILFSAPMVRAILDGRKTQTRRVVKPVGRDADFVLVERQHASGWWPYRSDDGESMFHTVRVGTKLYQDETPLSCPFGAVGDRLWVRENGWERPERTPKMMRDGADTWERYYYDADGYNTDSDAEQFKSWGFKRRPSIYMPRWASRITLEITGVRVERLQDISEADAIAEGVKRFPGVARDDDVAAFSRIGPVDFDSFPIARYAVLWESINGARSWDANPWVWVVEFRRIGHA